METSSGSATVVTMRVGLLLCSLALLLVAGCSGDSSGGEAAESTGEQVLRWGTGPNPDEDASPWDILASLSIDAPWNVFDPLVKVDDDLRAVPNIAERWDWSDDGRTLTFHLRRDGRWTNGDPLTAHDYAFGWRYSLEEDAPDVGAGIFAVIAGAEAYVKCLEDQGECGELRQDVGVRALDDYTLEVRLTEPQPWFPELVGGYSCVCFGPLHRATVERFGADWPEAEHIVTSGPFKIAAWKHGESLTLVRNEAWRDADRVELDRVEIRFFRESDDAAEALRAGEIDVADTDDASTSEYLVAYPFLKTQYIGFDVEDVPDARQRRAMALALDRGTIAERVYEGQFRPAVSMTADGVPDAGRIASDFLRPHARLEQARRLMDAVAEPRRTLKLWLPDAPRWLAEAAEVRAAWRRIGITTEVRAVPGDEYFDLLYGGKLEDAHVTNWVYDAPYPAYFLDVFRCTHGWNSTGWCDPAYERVLDRAASTLDDLARVALYAQAEAMLTGPDGAMPVIPIAWGSKVMLERPSVRESFDLNQMGLVDLTRVRVKAG